ncbi:hypothetical protein Tco_1358468 [Tanacetum coccineum]
MVATSEEHEHQGNQDNLNEISKEKDDAKPLISADTFGSNGTGSEVVAGLPKEFQEGDMVDALSRVVEQKSLGNWKESDNKSEDRKVERDAEREGEPTILATFGSDRGSYQLVTSSSSLASPLAAFFVAAFWFFRFTLSKGLVSEKSMCLCESTHTMNDGTFTTCLPTM